CDSGYCAGVHTDRRAGGAGGGVRPRRDHPAGPHCRAGAAMQYAGNRGGSHCLDRTGGRRVNAMALQERLTGWMKGAREQPRAASLAVLLGIAAMLLILLSEL